MTCQTSIEGGYHATYFHVRRVFEDLQNALKFWDSNYLEKVLPLKVKRFFFSRKEGK